MICRMASDASANQIKQNVSDYSYRCGSVSSAPTGLTATGGVSDRPGIARVRDGRAPLWRPWRTSDSSWRQSGPSVLLGRRPRPETGRVPTSRPWGRPLGPSRRPAQTAARDARCFPVPPRRQSSNASIPTRTGVGRPAPERSPSAPVMVVAATAQAAKSARGDRVLGGDGDPLPSASRSWRTHHTITATRSRLRWSDGSCGYAEAA